MIAQSISGLASSGFRSDGVAPAEGGCRGPGICIVRDVHRGGLHHPVGWGGRTGAAAGETGVSVRI
jgi:hypothetical protein